MPEPPRYDAAAEGMKPEWRAAFLARKKRRRWYGYLPLMAFPVAWSAFFITDVSPLFEGVEVQVALAVLGAYGGALLYLYAWLRRFPCPRCRQGFCAQDADAILDDRDDLACARCGLPNPFRRVREVEE